MLRPVTNGLIALLFCVGASSIPAHAQAPKAQKEPAQDPSTPYMHVNALSSGTVDSCPGQSRS